MQHVKMMCEGIFSGVPGGKDENRQSSAIAKTGSQHFSHSFLILSRSRQPAV